MNNQSENLPYQLRSLTAGGMKKEIILCIKF